MIGGLLALLAAATAAFSNVSARRAVITGNVLQGLAITVPIGVPIFLAVALVSGSLAAVAGFPSRSVAFLALAGVLHFVWGRYCNYRAIEAIGGNLAAPVQQASLLVSLGLAVLVLGEALTPLRIVGVALVMLGPTIMLRARRQARRPAGRDARPRPAFTPRFVEGYAFAILSSTGYGLSPILIRAALQGTGPGAGVAGGLISYATATAVVALVLLRPTTRGHVVGVDGRTLKWFTVSGVFICTAQMIRFMALSLAPVTVVTPIQRTTIVFRVLFAWIVNRDVEVFGVPVVVGIAVSLLGALALSLSTELVLSLIPLPESVAGLARWQWPGAP